MDHLHEVRTARASVAWLFEPGSPVLRDLLAANNPGEVVDLVSRGVPTDWLRAEVRHIPTERLWTTMNGALSDARRDGGRIVIPEDNEWPDGLADLATTPEIEAPAALCLWVRGDRPVAEALRRSVALTGARAATPYGRHVATDLSYGLAHRGWTVVTGGGHGIDTTAIRGGLTASGTTVVVLPAGLDHPYPPGNARLFDQVADTGLLVTVWPPGTTPNQARHTATNGLVAALSRGTVVVEAAHGNSGPLHTLRQAGRAHGDAGPRPRHLRPVRGLPRRAAPASSDPAGH